MNPVTFPYQSGKGAGARGALPYLPLMLHSLNDSGSTLEVEAPLDSGSSVNVLPRRVGDALGAVWEQQTVAVNLGGNLAAVDARGVLVSATVAEFAPVRLAFAWADTDAIPIILGQMNFFQLFDICFFGAESIFEIVPRRT